jgi:chromosome segregation ATPase
MEVEQILKQVEWLDEERRKDKSRISALEERLAALEGNVPPLVHQIKDVGSEITRVAAVLGRVDHFDETLTQLRLENKQKFDDLEKQFQRREEEREKVRRVEMRAVDTGLAEMRRAERFRVKRSLGACG